MRKNRTKKDKELYKLAGAIANDLKRIGYDKQELKEECEFFAEMYEVDAKALENRVNKAYHSFFLR